MKIFKKIKFIFYDLWVIPWGPYCYNCKTGKCCRYWSKRDAAPDGVPEQASGYCDYLKLGDDDINKDENRVFVNLKTGEKLTAPEMPIGVGLLWDQVKECGIKELGFFEKYNFWRKNNESTTPP